MLVIDQQYLFRVISELSGVNIREALTMCETLLSHNFFFSYTAPLKDKFLSKSDNYYKLGVFFQVAEYFEKYEYDYFYNLFQDKVYSLHDFEQTFDFINEKEYAIVLRAFGVTNNDVKDCLKEQNKKQTRFCIINKWYNSPKLQLGLI